MKTALGLGFTLLLASVPAAAGAAEPAPRPPSPVVAATPVTLDLGAALGAGVRLGDSQAYDVTGAGGFVVGASAWLAPSPNFAVGFTYQHVGLGHETTPVGPYGAVDVDRSAD